MAEDFHDEIDALAIEIERSIIKNKERLVKYEPDLGADYYDENGNVITEKLFGGSESE